MSMGWQTSPDAVTDGYLTNPPELQFPNETVVSDASEKPGAEGVPELEVRPRLGEEAPLRQQGFAPGASSEGDPQG